MCITAALGPMPWSSALQLMGAWSRNQFVANSALAALARKSGDFRCFSAVFGRFWPLFKGFQGVLGHARNPEAVQEHLCKCFDAISRVTFTEAGVYRVYKPGMRA